jgi:hypothetical protein
VDKSAKHFQRCDEFAHHMLDAFLTAALLAFLQQPNDTALNFEDGPTSAPLSDGDNHFASIRTIADAEIAARTFVKFHFEEPVLHPGKSVTKDSVLIAARGLMGHLFDYIEFRDAVRYEDPERIFRMWKVLIPFFIGAGNKNYAAESVKLFINLHARWSEFDAYIAFNNSTVNLNGIEGKGKAIDLLQEHINATIKIPLKESGSNYSEAHGATLSLVAMYLKKCIRLMSDETGATYNSPSHSNPKVETDIRLMVRKLQAQEVFSSKHKARNGWNPSFFTSNGYKKIENKWLEGLLKQQVELEDGVNGEEEDEEEDGKDADEEENDLEDLE